MGVDSLVLSFRTMFDQRAAEGLAARYELRLGEDRFRAEIADGRFEIPRGSADRPDAIIETDPGTLAGLIYDDRTLAEAMRSGGLEVTGDRSAFERFLGLFPLPGRARRQDVAPLAPFGGT
jgi:putative sterol carrier protein